MLKIKLEHKKNRTLQVRTGIRSGDDCQTCKSSCYDDLIFGHGDKVIYDQCVDKCKRHICL